MQEVELVYTVIEGPSDPGTHNVTRAVIGMRGAVCLDSIEWDDPDSAEAKLRDTEWVGKFGHPMLPMYTDLGIHARTEFEGGLQRMEDCELLKGPCWFGGSGLMGKALGNAWAEADRDEHALRTMLSVYYHQVYYDEGD